LPEPPALDSVLSALNPVRGYRRYPAAAAVPVQRFATLGDDEDAGDLDARFAALGGDEDDGDMEARFAAVNEDDDTDMEARSAPRARAGDDEDEDATGRRRAMAKQARSLRARA